MGWKVRVFTATDKRSTSPVYKKADMAILDSLHFQEQMLFIFCHPCTIKGWKNTKYFKHKKKKSNSNYSQMCILFKRLICLQHVRQKRITDEEHWGSSVLVGLSTYPGRRRFSHCFLWLCRHKKQQEKRRLPRYVKRPLWAQNWKTNDYRTEEKYERCTLSTLTLSDFR